MDDVTLLERWCGGDEASGEELFKRHFTSLHRFFAHKIGDDADELTQATFLACTEARDRIRNGAFRPFLFGIARKQLLRYFEGRGRGLPADALSRYSLADLSPTPSGILAQTREVESLLLAMTRIPVDCQVALEMFYWEEMSLAEIAQVLDIPSGTVKSRLHRAKARLSKRLEEIEAGAVFEEEQLRSLGGTRQPPS